MERHAALGWFVNDIHRHPLPYHFIRHAVRLAHMNRLVLHDAPVSVGRAFVRRDWLALIAEAGLAPDDVEIVWRLPFTYGVGRIRCRPWTPSSSAAGRRGPRPGPPPPHRGGARPWGGG